MDINTENLKEYFAEDNGVNSLQSVQNLLEVKSIDHAFIELTSKCNLRCVYCAVSNEGYVGYNMDDKSANDVIHTLITRGVKRVQLNGHGETTTVKNWSKYTDPLLESGVELELITNAALKFDDNTIEALARFFNIVISIDTIDPDLFIKMRRGGKFENIYYNMTRIRQRASELGVRGPTIGWSCVLTDKNIFSVLDLAREAIRLKVDGMVFCNLEKYERPADTFQVNHVATMPLSDVRKAYAIMHEVESLLRSNQIGYYIQDGFFVALDRVLAEDSQISTKPDESFVSVSEIEINGISDRESQSVIETELEAKLEAELNSVSAADSAKPMTRMCLDPWNFSFIKSNGDVSVCCWQVSVGSLKNSSFDEIICGEQAKQIRSRLLTGALDSHCMKCSARPLVATEVLVKTVSELKK